MKPFMEYNEYNKTKHERILDDMIAFYGHENTLYSLIVAGVKEGIKFGDEEQAKDVVEANMISIAFKAVDLCEKYQEQDNNRIEKILKMSKRVVKIAEEN